MSGFLYQRDVGAVPVKHWTRGVDFDEKAAEQVRNLATMPFIHRHVAIMPDVHWGMGSTIGSVIPTKGAVIPAAVGVDIGCGMIAVRTSYTADHLPDTLASLRMHIEEAVPVGRTLDKRGRGVDKGSWGGFGVGTIPNEVCYRWDRHLLKGFVQMVDKHPGIEKTNNLNHLGTLGTGNHFIEICLDEEERVWVMLHSGSRGVGNWIGRHFIDLAKKDMERYFIRLPDKDLAYLVEGSEHFEDYCFAVEWAQEYAKQSRIIMMSRVLKELFETLGALEGFKVSDEAINCHHNYVTRENHFGSNVWLTRKGAVCAREGVMGIIPGSMGARSFIVRGKGNLDSFNSCSHGAGRVMSRGEAKRKFSIDDHIEATRGVECRKDEGVIDETPGAYKDIQAVMAAQEDLVDIVHTLRQIVCVKG